MKTKTPTVDAQRIKQQLTRLIKKIGKRKQISANKLFELMAKIVNG